MTCGRRLRRTRAGRASTTPTACRARSSRRCGCAAHGIRAIMTGPEVLDLYDEVDRIVPLNGQRWVIAHIATFSQRDIELIVRMGLVLTTHTNANLYRPRDAIAQRLPPERHAEIVPLRSLL